MITNSFAAINIIHSGLIKKLGTDYELHIMSTMIRQAEINLIQNHFAIKLNVIDIEIPVEDGWLALLRKIEKAIFAQHFHIVTQKIKYQREARWQWSMIIFLLQILEQLCIDKLILRVLRRFVIHQTSFSSKLTSLLSYHFDGVISSSPLDMRENSIVNFLGRHQVRSMATIISWDNLTSKGVMNADHDCTLVWNEFMEREFLRFYSIFSFNSPAVKVTGIPRFDRYFQSQANAVEAPARLNVPNGKRIIFIATSAMRHFPNQLEVISDVVQFAEREGNVHIIIRCHPADEANNYKHLAHKHFVTIWHPDNLPVRDSNLFYNWFPEIDFLDSLSAMLRICDVCIQFASTMKLDAAACGKPIISIAYDGDNPVPHYQSAKKLYAYAHQVPLNALGLDELVLNKSQLFAALKASLHRKSQDNLAKIQPFIHYTEAKSVDFTAKIISEWLA